MKLVIFALLFLFCHGNIGASERNRDSEVLAEKTRVMMDEINRILRDFYNNLKDTQDPYKSGMSKPYHEKPSPYSQPSKPYSQPSPYNQPSKPYGGPIYNPEREKHQGENMRMFYDLKKRYADLQKHSQEVKMLKEQWTNSQYDENAYQRYAEEQAKYIEALNAYKQDVNKHNEMKRMLRGG